MKILAIYRHYWPDTTPYASILRTLLAHLAEQGHHVSVMAAQPSYNDLEHVRQPRHEILDRVHVWRTSLLPEKKTWPVMRLLNHCIFGLWATLNTALHPKYDLILGSSYPPVLGGILLRWIHGLTGIPYIYHCQDLHPESAQLGRKLRNPTLFRWLQAADTKTCQTALRTVVLSEDMKGTLVRRGVPAEHIVTINNFALETFPTRSAQPIAVSSGGPPNPSKNVLPTVFLDGDVEEEGTPSNSLEAAPRFRVLFAGNHGPFQGLERLMQATRLLAHDPSIQFIFMGTGQSKPQLIRQAGDLVGKTVHFLPHQSVAVAKAAIGAADLGVVSLLPGVHEVAFPSKTMMYLAEGCPVLGIVEAHSCLAQTIRDHDLGQVSQDTTPQKIAIAIQAEKERRAAALQSGKDVAQRHQAIARAYQELFGQGKALQAWNQLVHNCQQLASAACLSDTIPFERKAA